MSIIFEVACTEAHFEQILHLQRCNLMGNLSDGQKQKEGFVYAEHSLPLLKKMASHLPQVIALDKGQVVGYNLAMLSSMKTELPSLTPMFDEFENSDYNGKPLKQYPFVVGGQVCVDKAYRGQGLIKQLYHATKKNLPQGYQLCVTEIAADNTVSLKAHQKMGFHVIRRYFDGLTHWDIVAWVFD